MNRSIILALALVAFVYSQSTTITINPITPGTLKSGTLLPTTEANKYNPDFYSFVVPSSISSFDIAYTNVNDDCDYIDFYLRDEAPSCSTSLSGDFLCDYGSESDVSSTSTETYTLGSSDSLFNFVQNRTVYLTVVRDSVADATDTCAYTVLITFATTNPAPCAAGTVAYEEDSSTFICQPLTDITAGTSYTILSGEDVDALYRIQVPAATGTIYINGMFNDSSIEIYGQSYAAPSWYGSYECSSSSGTNYNSTSGFYSYSAVCTVPRVGDYYIAFQTDASDSLNGTFTVTYDNCSSSTAGYKCNFPLSALPTAATPVTLNIKSNETLEGPSGYSWVYYYFDAPTTAGASKTFGAIANITSGSAYMILRRGGFPEYNQYEYSSAEVRSLGTSLSSVGVNYYDFAIAGRFYLGFGCNYDCTITFAQNSTTTGGVVTTGTTTADASTTEQTSSSVVVAFSAILLFIAALF